MEEKKDLLKDFSPKELRAALVVYFLGVLHAVKLAKAGSIKLSVNEIMNFLKNTIRKTMDSRD